jgi:dihydropteroate synthase
MRDKDTFFSKKPNINIRGELFDLTNPCVMGIINITPDSFYSGNRLIDEKKALEQAGKILQEGGRIIDLGAYSSRPDAEDIDESTEKSRLQPVLKSIRNHYPDCIISLDTFRAPVAEWAVQEFGVNIINDISSGGLDAQMPRTVARLKTPVVLMHMRGKPQDMQQKTDYTNVTKDVITELSSKILLFQEAGVNDIIVDPGFGFSKTGEQNYELLSHLEMFKIFELPILVGISRKSMIYKLLHNSPEEALNGTTVLNTLALLKGADILRVHDVQEAVEVIKIVSMIKD